MDTLNSRALVTTFGSDAARYFRCVDPAGPDSQDWNHAMVVMTVLSPRCYGVVVKSPSVDHQDDQVVFSSMIQDDWTFAFEEKQQMVRWTTSANQEWFFLRFSLIEDFWLFVSQIAEARQCALRKRLESFDQLEAVVRSFRSFLVMGSAMNATNPYDGREDWSSVLFHDQAPQSEDLEEEDSE